MSRPLKAESADVWYWIVPYGQWWRSLTHQVPSSTFLGALLNPVLTLLLFIYPVTLGK